MNESYEFRGKNVDDAITNGLTELGLRRDQVELEVISEGSRGIFGLGSEPAIVRLIPQAVQTTSTADTAVSDAAADAVPATDLVDEDGDATSLTSDTLSTPADVADEPDMDDSVDEGGVAEAGSVDEDATSTNDALVDEVEDDGDISDDDLADMASDMLAEMISLMGFDAEIEASWKDPEPGEDDSALLLDVRGADLGPLIGRRGDTLSSIQYLLRLMVNQRLRAWKNIVVDVEQYKARRADQLMQLALRMADQVTETGRALSLEPMPSNERRVIHLALREHDSVYTESSGDGDRRKVHIIPKRMLD